MENSFYLIHPIGLIPTQKDILNAMFTRKKLGRPASLAKFAADIRILSSEGMGPTEIAEKLNISRASVYRWLEDAKEIFIALTEESALATWDRSPEYTISKLDYNISTLSNEYFYEQEMQRLKKLYNIKE